MTLVIIPARWGSQRLPGKPLEMIGNKTIIERCFRQAEKAGFRPIIATDSEEIIEHMLSLHGGPICVRTGECASGTDRVAAAAEIIDPEGKHEFIINYQGDMPFLDPELLRTFVEIREGFKGGILTAYCNMAYVYPYEFRRKTVSQHIGLYGFTRSTLRLFHAAEQTLMEKTERLEQWRLGMPESDVWHFTQWPSMPLEINTPADLAYARQIAACLS